MSSDVPRIPFIHSLAQSRRRITGGATVGIHIPYNRRDDRATIRVLYLRDRQFTGSTNVPCRALPPTTQPTVGQETFIIASRSPAVLLGRIMHRTSWLYVRPSVRPAKADDDAKILLGRRRCDPRCTRKSQVDVLAHCISHSSDCARLILMPLDACREDRITGRDRCALSVVYCARSVRRRHSQAVGRSFVNPPAKPCSATSFETSQLRFMVG